MLRHITYDVNSFIGGQNTDSNPYDLKNNEFVTAQNMTLNGEGYMEKRKGTAKINGTTTGTTDYFTTIHQHIDKYGNKTEYGIAGSKLYRNILGVWTEVVDAIGQKKVLSYNKRASMFSYKDTLFVANGNENCFSYGGGNFFTKNTFFIAYDNNVINKNDKDLNVLKQFGKTGTGNGEFTNIQSVAVDYTNKFIYVADRPNDVPTTSSYPIRIQKFDFEGVFLKSIISGGFSDTFYSMCCDTQGNLYIAMAGSFGGVTSKTLAIKYDINLTQIDSWNGVITSFTSGIRTGIYADSTNSKVYISSHDHKVYITDLDFNASSSFGGSGTGNGQFNKPSGIFVDETNNKVYVCDYSNNRIQHFALNGTYSGQWAVTGPSLISGIIDDSYIYVSTSTYLYRTNLTGTFSYTWPYGNIRGIGRSTPVAFVEQTEQDIFHDLGTPYSPIAKTTAEYGGTASAFGGTVLSDPSRNFLTDFDVPVIVGYYVTNTTTGATGTVTDVTSGAVGVINTTIPWKAGDKYLITVDTASGNPALYYKYKATYVNDATGEESSGGIESNIVFGNSKQIIITKLPYKLTTGFNPYGIPNGVTSYNLYRSSCATIDGTYSDYKYVQNVPLPVAGTTLPGDTDFTYDNLADGSEGEIIPTLNRIVPQFKYMFTYKDLLVGAGDPNDLNSVRWTNAYNPSFTQRNENAWDYDYFQPLGDDDGYPLNGIAPIGNYIVGIKDEVTYGGTFSIPSSGNPDGKIELTPYLITDDFGGASHYAIESVTLNGVNGLMWIDKDKGFVFCNGTSVVQLTDQMDSDFQALNKVYMKNAYSIYHRALNEYRVAITATGTTNNQVWVFNTLTKRICKYHTLNVCSFGRIENSSSLEEIWYGDFGGFAYKMDYGNDDASADIQSYFTTPWYDMNWKSHEKVFDMATIRFIRKGNWTFRVYWSVDGGSFTDYVDISQDGTVGTQGKWNFRFPSIRGQSIALKFENLTKDTPFEICGLTLMSRIRKVNYGG